MPPARGDGESDDARAEKRSRIENTAELFGHDREIDERLVGDRAAAVSLGDERRHPAERRAVAPNVAIERFGSLERLARLR
jgi:hypothetical protein